MNISITELFLSNAFKLSITNSAPISSFNHFAILIMVLDSFLDWIIYFTCIWKILTYYCLKYEWFCKFMHAIIQRLTLIYKSYMDTIHCRFEPVRLVNLEYLGCSPGDGHLSLECHHMYHSTASKHAVGERLHNRFVLDPRGRNPSGGD